jgi:hypothetical protein
MTDDDGRTSAHVGIRNSGKADDMLGEVMPHRETLVEGAGARAAKTAEGEQVNPQGHFLLHYYLQGFWERRRQMLKRPQVAGTYAFKCALLFLASAVFSWGLQAKLSLYKSQQSPSTVTVAKLLTERRSAQTMALLEKAPKPDTAWETLKLIPLLVLAQAILIHTFEFYQVEMNLCRFRRGDFHDPHLTQRPPPAFC